MSIDVVWKLGFPQRGGLHAFFAPGTAGATAFCSSHVKADGFPLSVPRVAPRCKLCVKRLALAEHFGITQSWDLPKNFAGISRSRRIEEERRSCWQVVRHGGRRNNPWHPIWIGPQAQAQALYARIQRMLTDARECSRRRGGVRLVDPDGHVDCEFIKSPWLKEKTSALPAQPNDPV